MGIKDGGSIKEGASYADKCRTAPAGTYKAEPPKGPKPEPVRTNGVRAPKERGVSKK